MERSVERISQRVEAIVHGVGYATLLLLMLLVTVRDIGRFTGGFSWFLIVLETSMINRLLGGFRRIWN